MVTFSCCMIVKNEEKVLSRCLDSIKDLMDEIIIIDTGSTDSTKEIATKYTDKIYDFKWVDDFSAARNFSFEKASCDYIYCPDADEYLDEENHKQLSYLKQCLDPEVDIVQMMYDTISENTVLNIKKEYRPRLFKRLRTFTWIDPIHETVRLEPVVFDSDIVITHAPLENHAKRDFSIYEINIKKKLPLSKRVISMYATELIKVGQLEDFENARDFFKEQYECTDSQEIKIQSCCVLVRLARLKNDKEEMQSLLPEYPLAETTSEICYDFGLFYMNGGEYKKAIDYLHLAVSDVPYALDVHTKGDLPFKALVDCYAALSKLAKSQEEISALTEELNLYEKMLHQWQPPVEQIICEN